MRELPHARTFVTPPDPLAHVAMRQAAEWMAAQEADVARAPSVIGVAIDYAPEIFGGGGYQVRVTIEP